METRLLGVDPLTGARTLYHHNHADDSFTIEEEQPVRDLFDVNQRMRNEAGLDYSGEMVQVASIPLNIYYELVDQGITRDAKRFKKWLNDRDNRNFRTNDGKV